MDRLAKSATEKVESCMMDRWFIVSRRVAVSWELDVLWIWTVKMAGK